MTSALRLIRVSFVVAAATLAIPAAALAQGKTMAQDDWVQTSAINWSGGALAAGGGGTRPAAGGEHEVEMDVHVGKAPPPRGPGTLSSSGKPGTAKEMDHASPKLAQFATNGNSPGPCRVGTRYSGLRLHDGRNRWLLSGVEVVGCAPSGMTVSYRSRQSL